MKDVCKYFYCYFGALIVQLQQIQSVFKNYGVALNCFEKLKQISTVLCFDQIEDVHSYCKLKGWKLSPLESKLIMTLRVDFNKQQIRALQI